MHPVFLATGTRRIAYSTCGVADAMASFRALPAAHEALGSCSSEAMGMSLNCPKPQFRDLCNPFNWQHSLRITVSQAWGQALGLQRGIRPVTFTLRSPQSSRKIANTLNAFLRAKDCSHISHVSAHQIFPTTLDGQYSQRHY